MSHSESRVTSGFHLKPNSEVGKEVSNDPSFKEGTLGKGPFIPSVDKYFFQESWTLCVGFLHCCTHPTQATLGTWTEKCTEASTETLLVLWAGGGGVSVRFLSLASAGISWST